jgi:hypothetical protein
MSLINDALKKAQKQRTGESPVFSSLPNVGGETPQRIARRAKPAGFETLMVRAGIGAVVLLVVVIGGYFAFRSDSEERRQVADNSNSAGGPVSAPAVSQPSAVSPQVSGLSPQVSAPPSAAPAPTFTLPVATQPTTPTSAPQVSLPGDRPGQTPGGQQTATARPPAPTGSDPRVSPFSPPSVSTPQVSGLRSQVSEPAKPALKLEPRAIEFIDNIKVAGIRASSTDAKVLMNDRVYRIGSLVDAELGLTLVEIAPNALTFEDQRGGRYTRTF